MALYTIHLAPDLSPAQRARAVLAGPRAVDAMASYPELLVRAGFVDVRGIDATAEFVEVARAVHRASTELAEGLRRALGAATFEQAQRDREELLRATEEGLLRRSLLLGRTPKG